MRRQGWCLVDQELEEGLISLAAPITNRAGETVAALNISGQANRSSARVMQAGMLPEGIKPKINLAQARLGRCAVPLRDMGSSQVHSIIESAAQHRLELKSKRLHRSVAAQGREQAIYQALAQTLGYRKNQQPFAILSQRLPLKRLLKLDAAKREALLFGVSGFLESLRVKDTQQETRLYLRQLWSAWWKT